MADKIYDWDQLAALNVSKNSYRVYKFAKQDLRRDIEAELEKRLDALKLKASEDANKALELGVVKSDLMGYITSDWKSLKEFLAVANPEPLYPVYLHSKYNKK